MKLSSRAWTATSNFLGSRQAIFWATVSRSAKAFQICLDNFIPSHFFNEIQQPLIRRIVTDPPSNRLRTAMVYVHFSWKVNCIADSNRADALLLASLRAGHTQLLKAYAHLLDPAADPTCPQTLEHWLQRCLNLDVLRQHTFGSPSPPLGVLTTDPEKVLALARATF